MRGDARPCREHVPERGDSDHSTDIARCGHRAACHALLLGEAGGDLHDVLIRPEHVRPAADGIALQVRDCVFTGERHALTLARADGTLLKAYSAERLAPGSMAVFSVERGWCL